MFYYIPWAILIFVSLVASITLLIWAYRSGQFADQGRARYLPLGESDLRTGAKNQAHPAKEPYALLALLLGTCTVLLFTLMLVMVKGKGG